MATISDLINDTSGMLIREQRTELNVLAAAADDDDTYIEVSHPTLNIRPGSLLGMDEEVMYVVSYDEPTRIATVIRGQLGSTPAIHSGGTTIFVDARFFRVEILRELRNEIRDLNDQLFAVDTLTLDYSPHQRVVELPALPYDQIYRVAAVSGDDWEPRPGSLMRTASTLAYRLDYEPTTNVTIHLTIAHSFDVANLDATTDLDDIGLRPFMYDIPAYGAAWRLIGPRDAERSAMWARGHSRTDEESRPMTALRTAEWFRTMRHELISDAAARLLAEYPWARR